MTSRWLALFAGALFVTMSGSAHADDIRRVAVLVGSNRPAPGRKPLHYAEDDARQLGEALVRVGHFAPSDVAVLTDPDAEAIKSALARAKATVAAAPGETLFVFYYSGHADGQSIYPKGEPVRIGALREVLASIHATARVGIVDACRGGAWTRTKGVSVAPPLENPVPFGMETEGTALISSSSGLESAHEADVVAGSFFTHHFVVGLLGAADKGGDGMVSLTEAFEYAKANTVRDSARYAPEVQHPSFELNLRGRADLVLTEPAVSGSQLVVTQTAGPLEVVHAQTGHIMIDLAPGERRVRLAVPQGRYVVRRVLDGTTWSREISVPAGSTVGIDEGQLELVGSTKLAMKGSEQGAPATPSPTPRRGGLAVALHSAAGNERGTTPTLGLRVLAATDVGSVTRIGATLTGERAVTTSFDLMAARLGGTIGWGAPWSDGVFGLSLEGGVALQYWQQDAAPALVAMIKDPAYIAKYGDESAFLPGKPETNLGGYGQVSVYFQLPKSDQWRPWIAGSFIKYIDPWKLDVSGSIDIGTAWSLW